MNSEIEAIILVGNYRYDTPLCIVFTDAKNGEIVDYFSVKTRDGTPYNVKEGKISRNKKYLCELENKGYLPIAIKYEHGTRTYYDISDDNE